MVKYIDSKSCSRQCTVCNGGARHASRATPTTTEYPCIGSTDPSIMYQAVPKLLFCTETVGPNRRSLSRSFIVP